MKHIRSRWPCELKLGCATARLLAREFTTLPPTTQGQHRGLLPLGLKHLKRKLRAHLHMMLRFKADSHKTCRSHAVPMPRPCRSPAVPDSHLPCHVPTMPFFSRPRHSTAVSRRRAVLCLENNGMVGACHGHSMASVNQTLPHCVNQM